MRYGWEEEERLEDDPVSCIGVEREARPLHKPLSCFKKQSADGFVKLLQTFRWAT